jgi:hypothetical protein
MARSEDEVKRDLEVERERLGSAVQKLRSQVDTLRRKLPIAALGAAGAGLAVRSIRRRISRRRAV